MITSLKLKNGEEIVILDVPINCVYNKHITKDNIIYADTNDSAAWDKLIFKLPSDGKYEFIDSKEKDLIILKKS